jgi:hypothetical protein
MPPLFLSNNIMTLDMIIKCSKLKFMHSVKYANVLNHLMTYLFKIILMIYITIYVIHRNSRYLEQESNSSRDCLYIL